MERGREIGKITMGGEPTPLTTENTSLWLHVPEHEEYDHVFIRAELENGKEAQARIFRYLCQHAMLFTAIREELEGNDDSEVHRYIRKPFAGDVKAYNQAAAVEMKQAARNLDDFDERPEWFQPI